MLSLIDADDAGLDVARALLEKRGGEADLWLRLPDVALLAPLPEPRQMRDGMSFATHIRQSARGGRAVQAMKTGGVEAFKAAMAAPLGELPAVYRQIPIYYITNRQTVVGPGATVRWPRYSKVMDYELEIAAITKRTRADIPAAEGDRHIFGYTIFNDFSARDRQMIEMEGRLGPAKGKSFDGSNAMGPWIVTADELGDPQALKVEVKINGETRSTGETSEMLFSFAEIIADASQDETIHGAKSSAPARSAIAAGSRSAASWKAATKSPCMSTGSGFCATPSSPKIELQRPEREETNGPPPDRLVDPPAEHRLCRPSRAWAEHRIRRP